MGKKKQENLLWDKVKYSLEKHYGYNCSNPHSKRRKLRKGFINIGVGGIIPDVIGIKDIGNQFEPQIEIITVEVKERLPNYRERHMDQVKRASAFAHKVYLAAPREFKPLEVELAVKQKIGLFELNPKTKRLKLIVPSPTFEPSKSKVIQFMRRLEYFKCSICECYWNKNLINVTGYRPQHVFSDKKKKKFVKFICEQCSDKLYVLHHKDLMNKFTEEWKLRLVNKRVEKLKSRSRKFVEKREIYRLTKKLAKQDIKIKQSKRVLKDTLGKKVSKLDKQFKKIKNSLKAI